MLAMDMSRLLTSVSAAIWVQDLYHKDQLVMLVILVYNGICLHRSYGSKSGKTCLNGQTKTFPSGGKKMIYL